MAAVDRPERLRRLRCGARNGAVPSKAAWTREGVHADHAGALELELLLDAIPPDRREAFLLTQIVGLTYSEAAEVVGVPVGTIRSPRRRSARRPHLVSDPTGCARVYVSDIA